MHHDHQTSQQSIHNLLGEALRETTDLARKEFTLFRTEMSQNLRLLVLGLVMLMGAMVFAVATLLLLTEALVEWVGSLVGSEALGALIVALLCGAVAVGLGLYGRSKLAAASLEPKHTIRQVKRDGEVLTERTH